jgi:hypothetical protein
VRKLKVPSRQPRQPASRGWVGWVVVTRSIAGFDMTLGGAKVPTREDTVARFRTTMQDAMEEGAQIGREATEAWWPVPAGAVATKLGVSDGWCRLESGAPAQH